MLAELDDLGAAVELHRRLRQAALPGVRELVPAARTVLVLFDPERTGPAALVDQIGSVAAQPASAAAPGSPADVTPVDLTPVEIPVRYDGADLAWVAMACGLSQEEVISRHSGTTYVVAFCGFAPGFAYLHGLDSRLVVPRHGSPRPRVPAGSVAIADRWSAIYPTASPGGWRILGHTKAPVWRPDLDPPTRLLPGAPVRFRDVP